MAPRINGARGTWEQPTRWGRNESGDYFVKKHSGTKNEIAILAADYNRLGYYYDVTEGNGETAILEARLPFNPTTGQQGADASISVATWELVGNKVGKDMLNAVQISSLITADQRQSLKQKWEQKTDDKVPTASQDGTAWTANQKSIYTLMLYGMSDWLIHQPIIRRTQVAASAYTGKASNTNVGRIYKTSRLTTEENIPNTIKFSLANDTDPSSANWGGLVLTYGWYKNSPNVTSTGNNRFQITQEWEYGLWPVLLYGTALT